MARLKSPRLRQSLLQAATDVIAAEGLSATTAAIAKRAGTSSGSLFVYFDTKATLLNELYVGLKTEMAVHATTGVDSCADAREQVHHMWTRWLTWATDEPNKRKALSHLQVSIDITEDSHRRVFAAYSQFASVLDRSRGDGPLRDAPLTFVLALTNAMADTTIDAMLADPAAAADRSQDGFGAVWQVLAGGASTPQPHPTSGPA